MQSDDNEPSNTNIIREEGNGLQSESTDDINEFNTTLSNSNFQKFDP